ncbi:hypothetical protein STEG23_031748 [Scotinomys teguina]
MKFADKRMELENVILSEVSQTQKNKHKLCDIVFYNVMLGTYRFDRYSSKNKIHKIGTKISLRQNSYGFKGFLIDPCKQNSYGFKVLCDQMSIHPIHNSKDKETITPKLKLMNWYAHDLTSCFKVLQL